ncbi:LysM peptidoglycan-binding domain-containing protein [Paenibacillus paeoniae]|uniref:LysM peptidoglycan-binding domain-containing protein n=1 Tax=Paenibacillus paeoniae TaxID=2292705 RepID=A0A371PFV6_9BACL|nr:LysM peptidoglycan-binding domain-containing protein [Paenibacillus paeoniae]REK74388.1 LysM peptidoglycan-binding domain-containing protein [Paenibacillus paeoniae]
MSYRMQLSFNNGTEVLDIQVLPSSIEISDGGKGNTYDVVGLGEINVIKERKLSEYAFSSFFPAKLYPFMLPPHDDKKNDPEPVVKVVPPIEQVRKISRWMESKRPIRFIFQGGTTASDVVINTPATIESFQWKEVAGGIGDIEYSIKLKHYRFYAAKKVVVQNNAVVPKGEQRPDDRAKAKTYTLVAGDTLWKVAKSKLGDGNRWREIQKLNGISDAETKRLQVGRVLKLP